MLSDSAKCAHMNDDTPQRTPHPDAEPRNEEANPLVRFVKQATTIMEIAIRYRIPPRFPLRTKAYIAIQERMKFWSDLIARVKRVSDCYERLHELTPIREADVITILLYYELTRIAEFLQQVEIVIPVGSEMEYLLGVSKKALAHPQVGSLLRSDAGAKSAPLDDGPVRRGVAGLQAFGTRDPDISQALNELRDLLQSKALPQIEACYDQAVMVARGSTVMHVEAESNRAKGANHGKV
jgi:hypothetical protein